MTNEDAVEGLKALAHPLRLKIVQALAGVERNVGEIDAIAAVGQPALSQQLAVLRAAGLVQTRREAKQVFYRVDDLRLGALGEVVSALVPETAGPTIAPASAVGVARFARLG